MSISMTGSKFVAGFIEFQKRVDLAKLDLLRLVASKAVLVAMMSDSVTASLPGARVCEVRGLPTQSVRWWT